VKAVHVKTVKEDSETWMQNLVRNARCSLFKEKYFGEGKADTGMTTRVRQMLFYKKLSKKIFLIG
jgi:hypothetical protein